MGQRKNERDIIEQYDYEDTDYLDSVLDDFAPAIGLFLINFSVLEHELTIAIAEFLVDDYHPLGLVIADKLTMNNKIDLFYRLSVLRDAATHRGTGAVKKLRQRLDEANVFRNRLVHASWGSLSKNGFVHTKADIDDSDGLVKRIRLNVSPELIQERAEEITDLIEMIDNYSEEIQS